MNQDELNINITPGQLLRLAIHELAGVSCRCGNPKQMKQTFCRRCYYTLPPDARKTLYRRAGEGYEEAYVNAVAFLVQDGRMPKPDWMIE